VVSGRVPSNQDDSAADYGAAGESAGNRRLSSIGEPSRTDYLHSVLPVNFERTYALDLVRQIATHARIYPASSDDFSPSPQDWVPNDHESIWYVLASENKKLLGMFACVPESLICWRIHVCLLPIAYGERSARAGRAVTRWLFENSPVLRLTGSIPKYNSLAIRFARLSGWKQFGVNEKSHMKDGKLHDQVLFGISKDELTWD